MTSQLVSLSLSWACRRALVCRVLPHSAALAIRRISLTAMEIRFYSDSMAPSHNPEVVGSNPAPAIHGNPIAASRLGLAVFVRGGLEIPARGVSELAGACRCAGCASTVVAGGATSRDCRVEREPGRLIDRTRDVARSLARVQVPRGRPRREGCS